MLLHVLSAASTHTRFYCFCSLCSCRPPLTASPVNSDAVTAWDRDRGYRLSLRGDKKIVSDSEMRSDVMIDPLKRRTSRMILRLCESACLLVHRTPCLMQLSIQSLITDCDILWFATNTNWNRIPIRRHQRAHRYVHWDAVAQFQAKETLLRRANSRLVASCCDACVLLY